MCIRDSIKTALDKIMEDGKDPVIPDELLEESVTRALKESAVVTDSGDGETGLAEVHSTAQVIIAQEKMEQFQEIMNHIIGRALEVNNEQLSQDVSSIVNDKVVKELEYLMRVKDEKEEERLDVYKRQLSGCLKGRRKFPLLWMP